MLFIKVKKKKSPPSKYHKYADLNTPKLIETDYCFRINDIYTSKI